MKTKLILPLLLLSGMVAAQSPITTAVPFLSITPDARGAGLADCGVASEADAYSMYYNPAKYAFIGSNTTVGLGYSRWTLGQTNLYNAAVAQRIGQRSTLAATFRYHQGLAVESLNTLGQWGGTFTPHDLAVDLGYAIRLNDALSLAVAGRYIQSNAFGKDDDVVNVYDRIKTGRSFAADLGVYYRKPVRLGGLDARLALGASITNLGTKIGYSKDKNPYLKEFIPTTLRLGTSLKVNLGGDHALTGMADLTKLLVPSQLTVESRDQSVFMGMIQSFYDAPGGFKEELYEINYGLGLDYAWRDMLHVRTGYFNQPALKGNLKYLSLGLGLELKHFGLDVCYDLSTTSAHNADYLKVDTHFKL